MIYGKLFGAPEPPMAARRWVKKDQILLTKCGHTTYGATSAMVCGTCGRKHEKGLTAVLIGACQTNDERKKVLALPALRGLLAAKRVFVMDFGDYIGFYLAQPQTAGQAAAA